MRIYLCNLYLAILSDHVRYSEKGIADGNGIIGAKIKSSK
jgi:hypothetical protein